MGSSQKFGGWLVGAWVSRRVEVCTVLPTLTPNCRARPCNYYVSNCVAADQSSKSALQILLVCTVCCATATATGFIAAVFATTLATAPFLLQLMSHSLCHLFVWSHSAPHCYWLCYCQSRSSLRSPPRSPRFGRRAAHRRCRSNFNQHRLPSPVCQGCTPFSLITTHQVLAPSIHNCSVHFYIQYNAGFNPAPYALHVSFQPFPGDYSSIQFIHFVFISIAVTLDCAQLLRAPSESLKQFRRNYFFT